MAYRTQIIFVDEHGGRHPIKYVNIYGRTYEFVPADGEILMVEKDDNV